ncbi:hypothetical protein [Pseudomonas fluorescens]|uniref:hypothetical protein n=1 Tax=Pseudomonas fluorescens TaxID=294 RepID=UPI00123F8E6D|nr:hypothetical protein [Pseudomonas fluorescens]
MTRNRAANLSSMRCCGALETWPRSQYSPRPPKSALKKSPDLIPDQKANLSRLWTVSRHSNPPLNRLFPNSRAGGFVLFERLGAALANSTAADRLDDFLQLENKAPNQSADLKKIPWNTYFLGATE